MGMGSDLAAILHDAQILNDKGIHAAVGSMTDQGLHFGQFLVGYQGIEGKMHRDTADMAVFHCFRQCLGCKILGALPGIKSAAAQINGICAVLNRCPEGFHRPRRGQKFQHKHTSPFCILAHIIAQIRLLRYPIQ